MYPYLTLGHDRHGLRTLTYVLGTLGTDRDVITQLWVRKAYAARITQISMYPSTNLGFWYVSENDLNTLPTR